MKRLGIVLGLVFVAACKKEGATGEAPDARADVCPSVQEGKLADRAADAQGFLKASVEEAKTEDGKPVVYARVTELVDGAGASAGTLLALRGDKLGADFASGDVVGLACSPGGSTLERGYVDAAGKAARACAKVSRAAGGLKVDALVDAKLDLHGEMGRATCARAVMCGKERRGDLARYASGVLSASKATSGDQIDALELYDVTKQSFVKEAGCEAVAEVLVPDKGADEINVGAVHSILWVATRPADDKARRAAMEKLSRLHARMGEKIKPLVDKQDAALRKDARLAYDRMDAADKTTFESIKRVLPRE